MDLLPELSLIRNNKTHVGEFNGKSVDVTDPLSVQALYSMGFYGKGHLSRSKPKDSNETLSLSLEEAFFLSYALEGLVVKYKGINLNLEETLEKFMASASNFLAKYVVYHHFKCKGWVIKMGLKFGCDYVLYWQSPESFHGSYLVLIADTTSKSGIFSWVDLFGFDRVAENASKELVLCFVELPFLGQRSLASFLSECKLKFDVLSRWVGAENRLKAE